MTRHPDEYMLPEVSAEWGHKWNPQIKYDGFNECPNCGCNLRERAKPSNTEGNKLDCGLDWYDYVVGFSPYIPRESSRGSIIGIIILDCPDCQSKFWYHCDSDLQDSLRRRCKNWPKGKNGLPL